MSKKNQDNKDNIILFPENKFSKQQSYVKDFRLAVGGTLAVVFLAMAGVNFSLLTEPTLNLNSLEIERHIASVPKLLPAKWQNDLKFKTVDFKGYKPKELDQFTFGDLKGRYGVAVKNGLVMNLTLGKDRSPIEVADPMSFLRNHSKVFFSPKVKKVVLHRTYSKKNNLVKVFHLVGDLEKKAIHMEFDENSHMIELEIQ